MDIDSYELAIQKVKEIREHRKKLYGNSWENDRDWQLLAQIVSKANRLENLIINKQVEDNGYDSIIDNATDLVNYTLFLLANKLRQKK